MGNQASKESKQQLKEIAKESGISLKVMTSMCKAMKRKTGGARFLTGNYLNYASDELRQIVQSAIDANQDGKMSVEEYIRFIVQLGSDDVDGRLKELFRVFDSDRNGSISREEVIRIFAAADEIYERVNSEERAENFFDTVDKDHDGKLTCEEFVQAAQEEASIMADMEEIRKIILGLPTARIVT